VEIKLLGTGSAQGLPGLFCRCRVCQLARVTRGKNHRTRSSALVDDTLKIDLPSDTLHHVLMHNLDLTRVEYLLFTHGHDDHFALRELQYMSWMFVEEVSQVPLNVLGPLDVVERVAQSLRVCDLPLRLQSLCLWEPVKLKGHEVTPIQAQHDPDMGCYNYLISDGYRTLLYASDTGWYDPPTWDFLMQTKLDGVVVECGNGPIEGGYKAHLCIPQVIQMREKLLEKGVLSADAPVVTTHHSHLGGMMHEELEAALNPHGIQVGYDGMVFSI
jgi:phosphoribosyl 1,2-cyclic phosphate phosphodiesterase